MKRILTFILTLTLALSFCVNSFAAATTATASKTQTGTSEAQTDTSKTQADTSEAQTDTLWKRGRHQEISCQYH